jgi:hypothetical protein
MKRLLASIPAVALCAAASAQVVPIGAFTGTHSEGFEMSNTGQFTPCISPRPFNNMADLCTPGFSGAHVTGGWGFMCSLPPHSGGRLYGSANGPSEWTFDIPVPRFGGYFATNSGTPDATVQFFDSAGNLLDTEIASVPANCTWVWNGWQSNLADIKRVRIIGNSFNQGAFIMLDDMEADFPCTGNPTVYCTAKVNSAGCTPSIGSTGIPDANLGSGFVIDVMNVLDNKFGVFFYSKTGPDNMPFQGGFLCTMPPLQRVPPSNAPPLNSGGIPPCGGMFSLDFNTWIASGNDPALVAGQQVWIQNWSRDPGSPSTTSFSDALTFVICP